MRPRALSDAAATPSMQTDCTAANPTRTGPVPNTDRTGPATSRPSGMPRPQIVVLAAMAFGRIATGMRSVQIEWIDGLQMPFAMPLTRIATNSVAAPTSRGSSQSGAAWNGTESAIRRSPSTRCVRKRNERMFPTSAPAPKAAKSAPATLASESKRSTVKHGHRREERLPGRVAGDEQRNPDTQQRLVDEKAQPREDPARLLGLRRGVAGRHEEHDEQERDDVGRRVDDEHVRGSHQADQDAADRRPEQHRRADRALEERIRLAHRLLVLPDQLRKDHPLGREVRRAENAEQERDHHERRQRQVPGPVEHRHEHHQRRAHRIGDQHRAPRSEPLHERPGRKACDGEARELGDHHDRHAGGRPGRRQHEPRQREPRHLGAGRGDDLGGEQRPQRSVPEDLRSAHARSSSRMLRHR